MTERQGPCEAVQDVCRGLEDSVAGDIDWREQGLQCSRLIGEMIEPSCLEMIESLPAETRDPKVLARGMR